MIHKFPTEVYNNAYHSYSKYTINVNNWIDKLPLEYWWHHVVVYDIIANTCSMMKHDWSHSTPHAVKYSNKIHNSNIKSHAFRFNLWMGIGILVSVNQRKQMRYISSRISRTNCIVGGGGRCPPFRDVCGWMKYSRIQIPLVLLTCKMCSLTG